METRIVEGKLSDRSIAHNVVIVVGSQRVVIAAVDLKGAQKIQDALSMYASHATITTT